MRNIHISIKNDFSEYPGCRLAKVSENSGEECRQHLIAPKLQEAIKEDVKLVVDLDGCAGYAGSFLDEVFAGLISNADFTFKQLHKHLRIISNDEKHWINDIQLFILDAAGRTDAKVNVKDVSTWYLEYRMIEDNMLEIE